MVDRETRKANLKKLQLPKTIVNKQQRGNRQTTSTNTKISNYVNAETLDNTNLNKDGSPMIGISDHKRNMPDSCGSPLEKMKRSRLKRTKLDDFIFKGSANIPASFKKEAEKYNNDDDIILPVKKSKKAPKSASNNQARTPRSLSRLKKQTTIKSAFLRNEQMFAEIAAQHCAVDQFDGDEVQMALAISRSEAESKGIHCSNEEEDGVINVEDVNKNAELIRDKLKKYGFRTAEKKDYNTLTAAFLPKAKRLKLKWCNKFTALTLRDPVVQFKKLQNNIEKLLSGQFRTKPLSEKELYIPLYKFQSSLLRKMIVPNMKTIFQNLDNVTQSNELFFVRELFDINVVPAGHLLKDWSAIQGRDFTPIAYRSQTGESLKRLQYIYQELEEYFSSRKCLNWEEDTENIDGQKENKKKETLLKVMGTTVKEEAHIQADNKKEYFEEAKVINNKKEIGDEGENVKTNKIIDLTNAIEKEEVESENKETNITIVHNNEIKKLLSNPKLLDKMHVSSCSINTQATINTTQTTRSISPDLFADSDVEIEEETKVEIGLNDPNNKYRSNSMEYIEAKIDNIIDKSCNRSLKVIESGEFTYEISSDEETSIVNSINNNNMDKMIDFSQDKLQSSSYNEINHKLNQSNPIVEVDLFAESPLSEHLSSDINSEPPKYMQGNSEKNFKRSLSLETSDNIEQKKKEENYLKLSLSPEMKEQINEFKTDNKHEDEEDDIILREIALDETSTSFLNFEGSKQLATCFYKETTSLEKEVLEEALTGNDTIFRELCNKYLTEASNLSISTKQKTNFEKSFTQPLLTVQAPLDFDMTVDNILPLSRKSTSFMDNTPHKTKKEYKNILSKHHSFNNDNLNVSIDLTQHDKVDCDKLSVDEDDDLLVLSDDEINYSIWQANKTANFHSSEHLDIENDVISISDVSQCDEEEKQFIVDFPKSDLKEFSYMQLNNNNDSLKKEIISDDFETLTSKYVSLKTPPQDVLIFDRSKFGILEEHSESIDNTPTKILKEASFLNSPTETTEPMKNYRNRSSQKFKDLLNHIDEKFLPHALGDLDEFDCLVYSSTYRTRSPIKKPQGIEKLLTGEIQFTEDMNTCKTVTKTSISPEKLSSELQEVKYNNKTYTLRYISSPKPNYTQLSEAELLKHLYNFGIKPLKRKHAVKMLEYIYNQTHPILIDNTVNEQNNLAENDHDNDRINVENVDRPCTSKSTLKAKDLVTKPSENVLNIPNTLKTVNNSNGVITKLNLKDSCGQEMLRYLHDLKAELLDENYILQTNVTKKTPQPLLPFHIAWYNLVCSNRKLHETILMYEPIDLQEIYLFLKDLGYRYDPKDLKTFFDRRSIIFRYDFTTAAGSKDHSKDVNRHVRKSKKSKVTNR